MERKKEGERRKARQGNEMIAETETKAKNKKLFLAFCLAVPVCVFCSADVGRTGLNFCHSVYDSTHQRTARRQNGAQRVELVAYIYSDFPVGLRSSWKFAATQSASAFDLLNEGMSAKTQGSIICPEAQCFSFL